MALDWKKTSQWWYGRFRINGRSQLINLGIKIEGHRPKSLTELGDVVFERSRGQAFQKHERILEQVRSRNNLQELTQRVIELKTGARFDSVKLTDLPRAWERIPRSHVPVKRYSQVVKSRLVRFIDFIQENSPAVEDLDMVTREHARAFMDAEELGALHRRPGMTP